MSTLNDVEEFLQAVFGSDYGTRAIFTNLNPAADTRHLAELDAGRDCYMGPWAYPDDGKLERGARATEARCLVIDDVGTAVDLFTGDAISKVSFEQVARLGPYTAVTRTSPGNHQYWFKLDPPVPAELWPGFRAGVIKILGVTPDNLGVGQIFRLPMGRNTKRGCNVELVDLKEGVTLKSATIPREAVVKPKAPGEARQVHDIKQLVEWASNDDLSYDEWIAKGQRIYALDPGEDGREAWHELSARSSKNDTEITETKWHTFTADITRGGLLLAEAQAAGGEAFTRWEAKEVFNDGVIEAEPPPKPEPRKGITATPFKWMDLSKTKPRDWLYGDILLRKFISMTVAPGGTGKSSLVAVETLAQVTGRDLLEEELPSGALRVWLWNLEDPYEETQKKILAAAKHYGIAEEEIGDRLFVDSGRDQRLVVAEMVGSIPKPVRPVIKELVEQIKLRQIDIVVIDPFISCHGVPENDNGAMDLVVKEWGRVAEEGNCAVHLVDHTSKAGSKEVVTDSSRGAKSKTDAARIVRVVNRMTDTDGKAYGIVDTWRYFNTFNDKANMAPPKSKRDWFRMEGILANNGANAAQVFSVGAAASALGDSIGVAVKWSPPNAKTMAAGDAYTKVIAVMGTKRWRTAPRSPDWVGNAIAQALCIDAPSISGRASINAIIKTWISEGLFKVSEQLDEKRRMKEFIELAQVY